MTMAVFHVGYAQLKDAVEIAPPFFQVDMLAMIDHHLKGTKGSHFCLPIFGLAWPTSGTQQGNFDGQVDNLRRGGSGVFPHAGARTPVCEERVLDLLKRPVAPFNRRVRVNGRQVRHDLDTVLFSKGTNGVGQELSTINVIARGVTANCVG